MQTCFIIPWGSAFVTIGRPTPVWQSPDLMKLQVQISNQCAFWPHCLGVMHAGLERAMPEKKRCSFLKGLIGFQLQKGTLWLVITQILSNSICLKKEVLCKCMEDAWNMNSVHVHTRWNTISKAFSKCAWNPYNRPSYLNNMHIFHSISQPFFHHCLLPFSTERFLIFSKVHQQRGSQSARAQIFVYHRCYSEESFTYTFSWINSKVSFCND